MLTGTLKTVILHSHHFKAMNIVLRLAIQSKATYICQSDAHRLYCHCSPVPRTALPHQSSWKLVSLVSEWWAFAHLHIVRAQGTPLIRDVSFKMLSSSRLPSNYPVSNGGRGHLGSQKLLLFQFVTFLCEQIQAIDSDFLISETVRQTKAVLSPPVQ